MRLGGKKAEIVAEVKDSCQVDAMASDVERRRATSSDVERRHLQRRATSSDVERRRAVSLASDVERRRATSSDVERRRAMSSDAIMMSDCQNCHQMIVLLMGSHCFSSVCHFWFRFVSFLMQFCHFYAFLPLSLRSRHIYNSFYHLLWFWVDAHKFYMHVGARGSIFRHKATYVVAASGTKFVAS